jgi:hypothetical protein
MVSLLLKVAEVRFGQPEPAVRSALESVAEPHRLERMIFNALSYGSLDEMMADLT